MTTTLNPVHVRSPFIYLASQSPRRSELLGRLGIEHRLLLPRDDEDAEALEAERVGELPARYVERVTRAKLRAAQARLRASALDHAPILCADTTVALGRRIFGKPVDADDARRMLTALAGRTHRAITAVAVVSAGGAARLRVSTSHVRFAPLAMNEIARYIDTGEPFGKAGAYAIQGVAGAWVTRIDGSYTGIMGLPLHETAVLLRGVGVEWRAP